MENGNGTLENEVVAGSRVWVVPDLVAFKSSRPVWSLPIAELPGCVESEEAMVS